MTDDTWNPYTDGEENKEGERNEEEEKNMIEEKLRGGFDQSDVYDDIIRTHAKTMPDEMKGATMTVLTSIMAGRVAGVIYRSTLDPDEFLEALETRVRRILESKGVGL